MKTLFVLTAWLFALVSGAAAAQSAWPNKPIRYIVPFPPGGPTDIHARLLGPKLSEFLGQPIVIENRAGATGTIGSAMLAKSPPDGYTIGGGNIATHAINMSVYAKMPYDNVRDFVSVAIFTTSPNILVVHPSLPIKSLAEYLAYAKANPGKLTFASPGSGSSVHLAGELLKLRTGAQITHVPYKGSGPAISDLVGGHVLSAFENSTSIVPQIKTGRVRAIAVTTARRAASFPDLPTIAEAGVPGYEVSSWQALFAPAGTPREIALRLNAAVRRVLALPDVREKLLGLDCEPADMTPGQFADFVEVETVKWAAVVKAARITAE